MTKPTKPTVPPAPSRSNPGPVFSQTADTFAAFQAPFADYLDAVAEFVDERADEALAAAIAGDLPPLTGQGGSFARAKPDGTAMEFRTPAQVRADLSINGIGSETAPTITNLNTLTVAGEYFAGGGSTGAPDGNVYLVKHYAGNITTAAFQEAFRFSDGARFWRRQAGSGWQSWTQAQPALGFTPVEQGGGAGMGSSKVRIGWRTDGFGLQAQVDSVSLGTLVRNFSPGGVQSDTLVAPGNPPLYAARAWVNFDGTNGAIRASGNVSSVVRNGVGDYTINFATAMPDANYAVAGAGAIFNVLAISTTSCRVYTSASNTLFDPVQCHVAIFR